MVNHMKEKLCNAELTIKIGQSNTKFAKASLAKRSDIPRLKIRKVSDWGG